MESSYVAWRNGGTRTMFGSFHGLPVHALAVHAAVVSVPLAALLAVLFAIPQTRAWSRIPLVVVAVGATISIYVAKESGEKLREVLGLGPGSSGPASKLIEEHQDAANLLFYFMLVFAVIAIAAFVLSRSNMTFEGPLMIVTCAVLVIGAGAVAYQTYKTGELGSKAVWNPTGGVDYGSSASP